MCLLPSFHGVGSISLSSIGNHITIEIPGVNGTMCHEYEDCGFVPGRKGGRDRENYNCGS